MYQCLVILVALISIIQGQVPVTGKCPEVAVQKDFDLTKYLGKWYEQANYPNPFELPGRCYEAEYTMLTNGKVKVHNSQVVEKSGKKGSIDGTARFADKSNEGKLLVTFSIRGVSRESPYWVLDTDYDSYAVVWSCTEMEVKQKLTSMRYLWLLTRARFPSAHIITKMHDIIDKSNISRSHLKTSSQENCTEKV